jgi:AraC-like DNA-binding protein
MKYEIIKPPKSLQKYVRYFSTLDYDGNSNNNNHIKVFADRYPHLVFQHQNGNSAFFKQDNPLPTTFISGVKINPYICDVSNTYSVTTVTFYPQAIKLLFGIDVSALNNELVDVHNFAPKHLTELLLSVDTHEKKIAILIDFLTKKLNNLGFEDSLIIESMKWINAINEETTIPSLQKHFKISERQLERRFKTATGLSPKQFLQSTRFEKSLKLIKENNFKNLSDIAFDLNYTDQSHFIKDFKEFSGFTPKVFLSQNKITQNTIPDNGVITINHLLVTS